MTTVRCYIPTIGKHYQGPDERTVVEWSEYPPNFTQEMWEERGPDCLVNRQLVVNWDQAFSIAKHHARQENNYGGIATIHRQQLDIYAEDRVPLGHWEYVGEGEEIDSD